MAEDAMTPEAIYRARVARFSAERDALDRDSARHANLNVVLFFGAIAGIVLGYWRGWAGWYALAALLAIGFVIVYRHHEGVDRRLRRARESVAINQEALARLARDWAHLPLRGDPSVAADHPFAGDLDVLGQASLQHLLNTVATPAGQDALKAMLLHLASPAIIARRQAAARELAGAIEWRDAINALGRFVGDTRHGYLELACWAEQPPWLAQRPWLIWYARIAPIVTIALLIAELNGALGLPLWLLAAGTNLAIMYGLAREVERRIDAVSERYEVFGAYAELFAVLTEATYQAPALRDLRDRLLAGKVGAGERMRRLSRIMPWAEFRRWYFYPVIQAFSLWSIHILWFLEGWQRESGAHVRDWLTVLGEMEALAALATLAYDHPDWAFPMVADDVPPRLEANQLGHPLLPPARCVRNDVALGPPGTFLLVTGSNMSGKSTLLRAIGTNIVLAQMGGPVCAGMLSIPPLALATSMRIRDSLEEGVSYFMAELQRLKLVVTAMDAAANADQPIGIYLLDEILHGTNTRERQIAARAILRHLLRQRAIGAVSTHDLTIADAPDLASASEPVYFTETFAGNDGARSMRFEYRLHPGLAPSTNALALVELVGLPLDGAVPDMLSHPVIIEPSAQE